MTGLSWASLAVSFLLLIVTADFTFERPSHLVWTTSVHAADTYNSQIVSVAFNFFFFFSVLAKVTASPCQDKWQLYVSLHALHVPCPLLQRHWCPHLACVSCTLWQFIRPPFPWALRYLWHTYPQPGQLCGLACLNCILVANSCLMYTSVNALSCKNRDILWQHRRELK